MLYNCKNAKVSSTANPQPKCYYRCLHYQGNTVNNTIDLLHIINIFETREKIIHNVKFTYTGNEEFVLAFQNFLIEEIKLKKTKLNFSKAKNPNNNTTKHICTMEYSGRGNIRKLYNYMYKNAFVFEESKKNKFEKILCALDEKSSSETELIAGNPLEP